MIQELKNDLTRYQNKFQGGRAQGWEKEELLKRAINSDYVVHHHAIWREGGHDDLAAIVVGVNGRNIIIQVKSDQLVSP